MKKKLSMSNRNCSSRQHVPTLSIGTFNKYFSYKPITVQIQREAVSKVLSDKNTS